jgi:hypothetical protein
MPAGVICTTLNPSISPGNIGLSDKVKRAAKQFAPLLKTIVHGNAASKAVERVNNSLSTLIEEFLTQFPVASATQTFGQHADIKSLVRNMVEATKALPAVSDRVNIDVSASVGKGNSATVPWLALLDSRETDSTQRGVYVVFLFPPDMSGVYTSAG